MLNSATHSFIPDPALVLSSPPIKLWDINKLQLSSSSTEFHIYKKNHQSYYVPVCKNAYNITCTQLYCLLKKLYFILYCTSLPFTYSLSSAISTRVSPNFKFEILTV